MKYLLAISLAYILSGCGVTSENEFNEKIYYENLEPQNIQVRRGITKFTGFLPYYENYCYIKVSGDDDYTYVTLEDEKYEYISQEQTTYSFYVDYEASYEYFTLEVDADEDDFIEIDINCY